MRPFTRAILTPEAIAFAVFDPIATALPSKDIMAGDRDVHKKWKKSINDSFIHTYVDTTLHRYLPEEDDKETAFEDWVALPKTATFVQMDLGPETEPT